MSKTMEQRVAVIGVTDNGRRYIARTNKGVFVTESGLTKEARERIGEKLRDLESRRGDGIVKYVHQGAQSGARHTLLDITPIESRIPD
jgi:hypothetical protein